MKHYVILACVYSLAEAAHYKPRSSWSSLSANRVETPRLSLLRRENDLNLLPRPHILFRRGRSLRLGKPSANKGSPEIERPIPPPDLSSSKPDPRRLGSPNAKSKVTAQGPADMHTQTAAGRRQVQVGGGGHPGSMYSSDPHQSSAWGRSVGEAVTPPRAQKMTAEARGRSVYGKVEPPPGGTGAIQVESNQGEGQLVKYHVPGHSNNLHIFSSHPGGARVKTETDHGGLVAVTASNQHHQVPDLPDHMR
ncbi:MAG: hypothetical protein GOMPHAMPRED_006842 [Gomphillus americanus]|uniref:Uncharacterized protein n=1 Tax=Gomphillus americanus TaxID=1940652 RepID=A0A8H3ENF0_9LECA|nr:MAG: hypothetical protein GOMPHAMPRED_006842 [Gomphillus americanus]